MIQKRKSRIQGWGVFATEVIPKNKRIIHYAGEKVSNQESLRRERRYIRNNHIWCFKLTNRTVVDADQIMVLSEGRVAETGTHAELLAHGGLYARMWALQALEREEAEPETEPAV